MDPLSQLVISQNTRTHRKYCSILMTYFLDGDFPPLCALPEPHNAICKAIVDMAEEITWLKHLGVTGVFKDDSAGREME